MLPSLGRVSGLAVALLFASLLVQSVNGFFPTTWKEVLFGYGGVSHQEQTEIAFAALAAKYFPDINHLPKSMLKARDTISEANAKVDEDQDHSALHCDGENFDGAQVRLQKLHDTVIEQLDLGLPDEARKSLGSALHTVQDFYAHSNWVELGNTAPSNLLGRTSSIPHARPLDPTCSDCLPHSDSDMTQDICLNCRLNEVGFMSLLTSGYYADEPDAIVPDGVAKCRHGGFTDGNVFSSVTAGPSNPGINKDSLYCGWSPHFFLHNQAVSVSIAATEQYIDDIKSAITSSQLRQLFGVGPTLAFCIDTTGSMGDIIAAVQEESIKIVTERLGTPDEPSTYIVSPFNDPTTGPVSATSNVEEFKSQILNLGAGGGGDCPELALTGMIGAIEKMDADSTLFVFTDAAASDYARAGELITLALEKSIKCYIIKFDSGCDDGVSGGGKFKRVDGASDEVYHPIALATGGGYHSLPRNAAANITNLVDSLTLSDSNFILRIHDTLPEDGSTAYFVPADSSLKQLTISLRGPEVTMLITDPTGTPLDPASVGVTIVTVTDGSFITIKNPKVGSWRVEVSGTGDFNLDATGIGPLHFSSFNFARLSGRPGHTGYYPVPGSPPYNSDVAAIGALDGPFASAEFSFRLPDGTTLNTLSMIQGTGAAGDPPPNQFFTTLRLTAVDRYVYVDGTDSEGTFYQRLLPQAFTPVFSNDTFPLGRITGPPSSTISSASSMSSLASVGASSSAVSELPVRPVYPAYPVYDDLRSSLSSPVSFEPSTSAISVSSMDSASSLVSSSHLEVSTRSSPFVDMSTSAAPEPTVNPAYGSSLSSQSSVELSSVTTSWPITRYMSDFASSSSSEMSTGASLTASHGPFTNSSRMASSTSVSSSTSSDPFAKPTSAVRSMYPGASISASFSTSITSFETRTSKSGSSLSISGSLSMSSSRSMTSSQSLISTSPSSSGPRENATPVSNYSPIFSATSSKDISEVSTVTSEVVTATPCPITVSNTVSGVVHTTVTYSMSSITFTSTSTIPCKRCTGHASMPTSVSIGPSLTSVLSETPAIAESELPPVTIIEIVYVSTSTCPATLSTEDHLGSTTYILTHSVTTRTLTSVKTPLCEKCGPRTVTLTIGSVPPAVPSYVTPGPAPVGLPALSAHMCYGGDCGSSLSPSPAPTDRPVFLPSSTNPTYPAPSSIPAFPSAPILVCHEPGCPIVAPPSPDFPTRPGCSGPGCPGAIAPSPASVSVPSNLSSPAPSPALGCSGPGCPGVLSTYGSPSIPPPPGNATTSVPSSTPLVFTYTGGMDRRLSLVATTVALGIVISVVVSMVLL